jgi:hypothetical protein
MGNQLRRVVQHLRRVIGPLRDGQLSDAELLYLISAPSSS